MVILGLDTSGEYASCALCSENKIIGETSLAARRTHSQIILPMAKKLLEEAELTLEQIDRFAVVNGPGSYTGLRIGIAAVKGICFALGKECTGVSALEALAYGVAAGIPGEMLIFSVNHARQDLVYCGVFRTVGGVVSRERQDCIRPVRQVAEEIVRCGLQVCITGNYTDEVTALCRGFCGDNWFAAPVMQRTPRAAAVCFAAADREPCSAEELAPAYLQITKAEKDLADGG